MRTSAIVLLALATAIHGASVRRKACSDELAPRDEYDAAPSGAASSAAWAAAFSAGAPSAGSIAARGPGKGKQTDDAPPPAGGPGPNNSGSCPDVWRSVKAELKTLFMSGSVCNDKARAAIRAVFHDCGTWTTAQAGTGGCDGSLFTGTTPDVELDRSENAGPGMAKVAVLLKDLAHKYGVSVADMIVFAGNAATLLCPLGPVVPTFIGRTDTTRSAPQSMLPNVNAPAADLVSLFAQKGLDSVELAALLGAHSTSTQFVTVPSAVNASQDTTPGVWDVLYYAQTVKFARTNQPLPAGMVVFESDRKLATFGQVGTAMAQFANDQTGWNSLYASAMAKMSLFGNDRSTMVDCTSALTS